MKLIRELQGDFDPPQENGAQPRPHRREDIRTLLDAVAKSIPFIGYESVGTKEIHDDVAEAFSRVAGMDWHKWQKTGEDKDI